MIVFRRASRLKAAQRVSRREAVLDRCARIAVGVVLALAVLNWVGWSTGNSNLTQIFASSPHMPPWSAVILAALGVALLLQLGRPAPARVWAGGGLAAAAGVLSAVFVAEYAAGRSFGLDSLLFADAVQAMQLTGQVRPSAWTALSALVLGIAIAVTRLEHRWARLAWPACLAAAAVLPTVTAMRYVFEAFLLMDAKRSSGQAIGSVASLLLLIAATLMACPGRDPVAWLLARPDRWTLVRMIGILAGLPLVVGLSRLLFLEFGLDGDGVWVLSIMVGTVVVGVAVFFASQREQGLLIEKEQLSTERAEAEALYGILLEAAPDALIIVGPDGRIMLANAQTDRMFGYPRDELVGSEVEKLLPPRLRGRHAYYRWDFFADPSVRTMGAGLELRGMRQDGSEFPVSITLSPLRTVQRLQVLAAIRDVTEAHENEQRLRSQHEHLIEAQHELKRLARVDSLTGLVNRGETISRLESALQNSRSPGSELGVLFCDVDRFKTINDTWGHGAGDAVLATLADRILGCVRHGDTVGRTGGDEMLVLLPGLHSLDEVAQIAEKIRRRAAEPIHHCGSTFDATLSIGATLAIPGETVPDTTARADAAMYQVKRVGGNSVTCI